MLRLRPRRLVLARCRRHLSRLSLPSSLLCFLAPRSGSELRLLAGGCMPFADCGFIVNLEASRTFLEPRRWVPNPAPGFESNPPAFFCSVSLLACSHA
ncbi:hypothetical protein SLEP1_g8881 [Rubroshorea leprosula]|uniref:Secreted protein n=1 Tax=Rubroshorea leprosula TaxID=152421 RepID=A0AAV5I953_9ROSI|nr:hypothetical protein SLEP1_g8881 [Rubroshorea leprosula]